MPIQSLGFKINTCRRLRGSWTSRRSQGSCANPIRSSGVSTVCWSHALLSKHGQAFVPLPHSLGLWVAPGRHEMGKTDPEGAGSCGQLLTALLAAGHRALFVGRSGCPMSLLTRMVWTLSVPHTQGCVFLTIHITQAVLLHETRGSPTNA